MPELPEGDAVLEQFNLLMQELLRGNLRRSNFRPWEIEVLLDIESCDLGTASRAGVLRRYQRAAQRHLIEKRSPLPPKLSEYLESVQRKPPSAERSTGAQRKVRKKR